MNSVDIIDNCLAEKENRTVTVGLLENDIPQYIVFGGGGAIIAPKEYEYELCGVTNVLTAAIVQGLISQKKLSLLSPCSAFLGEMPEGYDFTVEQMLTHTSGLSPNILTTAKRVYSMLRPHHNPTLGINIDNIKEHIQSYKIEENRGYCYCGANFALLGEMVAKCCKQNFAKIITDFTKQELRIMNMRISNGEGDVGTHYLHRGANDSFIAADGIVATVIDVLKLLQQVLNRNEFLYPCTQIVSSFATQQGYGIGAGWLISKNGIAWQAGASNGFNSFVGVDFEYSRAVTVLSNSQSMVHQSATEAGLRYLHEKRENNEFIFI